MEYQDPQMVDRYIRELNNLNDNILDNAPIAIHVVDRDFMVLKWNKYLEKTTSIKKSDIIGKKLLDVVPETRTSGRYEALLGVMTSGEPFHELGQRMIRSVGTQQGEVRYQDVSIVPLREQGEIIGTITILADVTERKRADEQRQQAELEVAQSRARLAHFSRVQTMGELASTIAHEISQPLAAVEGYTQAALNYLERGDIEPSKLMDLLARIKEQAGRVSGIIEHTRSLVKKQKTELTCIDLNKLVEDTVKLAEFDLMANDCELSLRLSNSPLLVRIDKAQVQGVIINLLRNAIEAVVGQESADKTIEIFTKYEKQSIWLVVADRGPGVLPEDEGELFEPFFSTKDEGLGIGLVLCRSIMEALGGEACYNQRAKGGSEFRLSFPSA